MAIILITHDLAAVAEISDRIIVMYAGEVVEAGSVDDIFYRPQHPYTRGLLASVPRLDRVSDDELQAIVRLALSVQRQVGSHLNATAFNLALKDGKGAGQPVPHLHLHVVPRTAGDLAVNDEVYGRIDRWSPAGEPNVVPPMVLPPDEARRGGAGG